MTMELEARIRKVEDFQEITNLQARYAFLIDELELDDLVELFAEDFVWEVGFDRMTRFTSKPDLLEFLKRFSKENTMQRHQPITPYIEIDGDSAKGTWYLFGMTTSVTPQGEGARWVQGKYKNEYVRIGGVWKFSRLSFKFTFHTPYEDGWVKTPVPPR